MGKITRKIKAIAKLHKRKKKQTALQKEEKAVLKVLQSMEIGDIQKVALQGHTFLARRHAEGFEYSTNSELMDMIDKVGKAFDKVVPKFESENDFEVWRKTLPSWGEVEEEEGIVKYGDVVPIQKVTSRPPDLPLPSGVAEAYVDQKTYDRWMASLHPQMREIGLRFGRDINASIQFMLPNVRVRWKALTPKGEQFLYIMAESLVVAQLSSPNLQLPGPTNEISNLH